MVSGKTAKRKTLKENATQEPAPSPQADGANSHAAALRNTLIALCVVLLLVAVGFGTFFALKAFNDSSVEPETPVEPAEPVEPVEPEPEPEPVLPDTINFQPVVDEWAASVGGNRSVIIYDLERGEIAGQYNPDEDYNTASLYKLFVVYEGYRRLQSGEWSADDVAGGTERTILECLDLAVRESYSPCAETLWNYIGHEELDRIIAEDFGITNSDISHLVSNPHDILKIMQLFYEHPHFSDETLVARMKDSFLVQPVTTYNWRQGLPSGFSENVNVYNKVGWDYNPDGGYWNIYHDAAIVEFPELDRHFVVIVMTNRVPYQRIRDFARMIEEAV